MNRLMLLTTSTGFDWSTLDLKPVTTEFYKAVPIVVTVVLGFIAFRKAWAFVVGAIKRA